MNELTNSAETDCCGISIPPGFMDAEVNLQSGKWTARHFNDGSWKIIDPDGSVAGSFTDATTMAIHFAMQAEEVRRLNDGKLSTLERLSLHNFANDREQHTITHYTWKLNRGNGVTLYAFGDFFTAYYGDAMELHQQADDDLPMFHVLARGAGPHRTVICARSLVAWVQHFAESCMPVQILGAEGEE